MKKFFLLTFYILLFCNSKSFSINTDDTKPKLVIGIVVDQMRYDFLYRYMDMYSENGFKKLLDKGFSCSQTHYNYMPTYTGPGHACIYTGTTPSMNGIISNNWFVRNLNKEIYCAQDDSMKTIGSNSIAGKMSPKNLLTTTITDQLRLSTNGRSKTIGIALKDRGAILPAGRDANAAYWFDDASQNWITSSYYMNALPTWVNDFNLKKIPLQYMSQSWNTFYPIEKYVQSSADNNSFESKFPLELTPTFPHNLKAIYDSTKNIGYIRTSPFGNTLTTDFAIATLEGEQLGKGNETDFLCISYSSTDYVGHTFGPNSIETEDVYIRLDLEISRLLNYIDKTYGKENILIFLTADHGVTEVPSYLKSLRMSAGYIDEKAIIKNAKTFCSQAFSDSLIISYSNQQFYLNHEKINSLKLELADVQTALANDAINYEGVYQTYTASQMVNISYNHTPAYQIQNGYNQKLSGDVMINYLPNYIDFGITGTTHGTPYSYDTHVPLVFYGWKIKHNENSINCEVSDIAPTLAQLLHIMEPSGCTGKPIQSVIESTK
jgi:predicted AlkP superfamily pyrophosphatase or phosphodiesterase